MFVHHSAIVWLLLMVTGYIWTVVLTLCGHLHYKTCFKWCLYRNKKFTYSVIQDGRTQYSKTSFGSDTIQRWQQLRGLLIYFFSSLFFLSLTYLFLLYFICLWAPRRNLNRIIKHKCYFYQLCLCSCENIKQLMVF